MSGLLLVHDCHGAATVDRLTATQAAAGVAELGRWRAGGWTLVLFSSLAGEDPVRFVTMPDGRFAAVAGTFFYRGASGEAALTRALADSTDGRFDVDTAVGHYVLASGDGSAVRLMGDPLGSLRLYHNPAGTIVSTLFMSVLEAAPSLSINTQGLYEFVWLEAAYGIRTPFNEVAVAPAGQIAVASADHVSWIAGPSVDWLTPTWTLGATADALSHYARSLTGLFAPLSGHYGGKTCTALSGGYDSRLCAAALRRANSDMRLLVYGAPGDDDRTVAEAIAQGSGLSIAVTDRSEAQARTPLPDRRTIDREAVQFDGLKNYGTIGSLADDARTRRERLNGVDLFINGSGGEIFRNFFYLPDGSYSVDDVVSSFYSTYQPAACAGAFDEAAFRAGLAQTISQAIGAQPEGPVTRQQIELIYPLIRLRYWTSHDLAQNVRFGGVIYPFLCHQVIRGTATLPITEKSYGRFEGALIRALDPELAGFTSAYGFAFDAPPPSSYVLKMQATYRRPPWLRRYSYRLQTLNADRRPEALQPAALSQIIDPELGHLADWLHPGAIARAPAFARAASLQHLMEWHGRARSAGGGASLL